MSLKPQMTLFPAIAIWWWSGRERWYAFAAFLSIVVVSILIWGPWPIWVIEKVFSHMNRGGYDLWNTSIGFYAIPLIVPALYIPLNRRDRLLALTATGILISPYLPYYSTLILLCFPLPWILYIFGFVGYLPNIVTPLGAWKSITLLPVTVLIYTYWPYFQTLVKNTGNFSKK